jgi:hypothetical protein
LRREAQQAERSVRRQAEVESSISSLPFEPQLYRAPSWVEIDRPSILQPAEYLRESANRSFAKMANLEKDARERDEESFFECSFRPQVNAGAPAFVRDMAELYRAERELREEEARSLQTSPARPEWR